MRLLRALAVTLVLLVLVNVPFAGWTGNKQRTETEPYTAGLDGVVHCETNTGGACFDLAGNERSVEIVIADMTEMPVAGVYEFGDDSGAVLAQGMFCESTALPVPSRATGLVIYVAGPAFGLLSCGAQGSVGAGTTGTITVDYDVKGGTREPGPRPIDTERECLEPAPDSLGVQGVTDEGQNVSLDVFVLLDGVTSDQANAVFTTAAESYAPLGITLTWITQTVSFTGDDAFGMLTQAKDLFRGQRPKGYDVVFTLTTKDLTVLGQTAVAGAADCIGGVRFPERAFAVGEVIEFENTAFGPLTFYKHATAETAAHEIGHLMGGHHQYANCVEGAPTAVEENEPAPCTLMFNSLDFMSRNFGLPNGAVVRGHAVTYASP